MKRIRRAWQRVRVTTSMICRRRTWAAIICTPRFRKTYRKVEDVIFVACEFGINKGMRALGPLLACLAIILIGLVTFEYFSQIFPVLIELFSENHGIFSFIGGNSETYLITLFGLWCLINIVFNHQSCVWTKPGFAPNTPRQCPPHYDKIIQTHYRHDPEIKTHQTMRYCETCKCHKPWRAHHCSICKKCVLRMDHHCPWMWNCVGFQNYRYFFMFLFYLWVGTLFYIIVGYYRVRQLYKVKSCWFDGLPFFLCRLTKNRDFINQESNINVNNDINNGGHFISGWRWGLTGLIMDTFVVPHANNAHTELFIFSYFLCIGIFIVMTGFLGWHAYLVLTNQTTLESITNVSKSMRKLRRFEQLHDKKFLYNLGSWKLNWIQIFGRKWWKAFLPMWTKPCGNGFVYPLRNEIKNIVYIDTTNALNV